jgi:AAA domain
MKMSATLLRPISLDQHPLRDRTYRVPTPSIASFRALIDECLFLYHTGALIYGHSRIGKTYAIDFLKADISRRYPGINILRIRSHRTQTPSETTFFGALLHSAQHAVTKTALRGRLVHKLRQVADKNKETRIILFVDEAQNLREIEYEWLRDLHDDLESNALRLFAFLVGQRQLLAQKSAFEAQDREHIVTRFMLDELEFRGISSNSECKSVLAAFDKSVCPPKTDWNYTRFCVPKAHEAGLRLEDSADALWQEFESAHLEAGIEAALEVPMKYFTAAIEGALLVSFQNDSPTLHWDPPFWQQMVARSRYVQSRASRRKTFSNITWR